MAIEVVNVIRGEMKTYFVFQPGPIPAVFAYPYRQSPNPHRTNACRSMPAVVEILPQTNRRDGQHAQDEQQPFCRLFHRARRCNCPAPDKALFSVFLRDKAPSFALPRLTRSEYVCS